MRQLFFILLVAIPAFADDDYYSRQLENRRIENNLYEQQRQNTVFETQRVEAVRVRNQQERQDQEAADKQYQQQMTQRYGPKPGGYVMPSRKAVVTKPRCAPLQLTGTQRVDVEGTGYFQADSEFPYVLGSMRIGPDAAATKLTVISKLAHDRATKQLYVFKTSITLYVDETAFETVEGTFDLTRADLNTLTGRHEFTVKNLMLKARDGRCFVAPNFSWSAGWDRR